MNDGIGIHECLRNICSTRKGSSPFSSTKYAGLAQLEEHFPYKEGVGSSSLSTCTSGLETLFETGILVNGLW